MPASWQDRWGVPLTAMTIAAMGIYTYVLDGSSSSGWNAGMVPIPVATPVTVAVDPKLRDPLMVGNEWDAILVNRNKLLRDRAQAVEDAKEAEERRKQEQEDEEYFRQTGKRRPRDLARRAERGKLLSDTISPTSTRRRSALPPLPPPVPKFTIAGVVMAGSQRTAVVNEKVVAVGDIVGGFRVLKLSLDVVELEGTQDPWKGKRVSLETRPAPKGISFLSAQDVLRAASTRGKRLPEGGAARRPVSVLPTVVGDPVSAPPPAPRPSASAAGPPADDRPWWKKVLSEAPRASPAPGPSPDQGKGGTSPGGGWWSGFVRQGYQPHPMEDRPR